jgi:hypothetical protein
MTLAARLFKYFDHTRAPSCSWLISTGNRLTTPNQMIVIGEAALRTVIQSYLGHYHHERKHQGRGSQLIVPESGMKNQRGLVVRRERLGGLLSYYHREAA